MGFKVPVTTDVVLQFGDSAEDAGDALVPAMAGAEITCRSLTSAQIAEMDRELANPPKDDKRPLEQRVGAYFAEKLITSWNLEDEGGTPLPIEADTFATKVSPWVSLAIRGAYYSAVLTPPAPLGQPSSNGAHPGD